MSKRKFPTLIYVIAVSLIGASTILVLCFLVFPHTVNNHQITNNEFSITKDCIKLSNELLTRCKEAGGVLQTELVANGLHFTYEHGCFPQGKTIDAGAKCKKDSQCQGECNWLAGDLITEDSSSTCSDFKKPFFSYETTDDSSVFCSEKDD